MNPEYAQEFLGVEQAEASPEALREERLALFNGYAGRKVAEAAELAGVKIKSSYEKIANAEPADQLRYAIAGSAMLSSYLLLAAKMPRGAAIATIIERGLTAPELFQGALAMAKTRAPSLVPYLEASAAFLSDKKELLENAAQEAATMLRGDLTSLNLNG